MKKAIVTSIFHHLRLNAKLIEYSILVSIDVWSTLVNVNAVRYICQIDTLTQYHKMISMH